MLETSDIRSLQSDLRFLTNTLSVTSVQNLPYVTARLIPTVENCHGAFVIAEEQGRDRPVTDLRVLVHTYKSQLTSLLQGKTVGGRWAAVALIKVTVEAGLQVLVPDTKQWIRGMLAILTKPGASATKIMCILTLARIFILSRSDSGLVRELSTPTLPTFMTSCLGLFTVQGPAESFVPVFESVLSAFHELLYRYPTTLRPFAPRIHHLLLPMLAPTSSSVEDGEDGLPVRTISLTNPSLCVKARQLFVRLHFSAAKGMAGDEWLAAYRAVEAEITGTADLVFRSLRRGTQQIIVPSGGKADSGFQRERLCQTAVGPLKLPRWTGMMSGMDRMAQLFDILRQFYLERTGITVVVPLGTTVNLIARALSVIACSNGKVSDSWTGHDGTDSDIDEDEALAVWAGAPQVHIAALKLCSVLLDRLERMNLPVAQGILQQLICISGAESRDSTIRTISYSVMAKLLELSGPSWPKSVVVSLASLVRQACDDLFPTTAENKFGIRPSAGDGRQSHPKLKPDPEAFLKSLSNSPWTPENRMASRSEVSEAAWNLLPVYLRRISPRHMEHGLRAKIDRTAILAQHKYAMMASVLHPPWKGTESNPASSVMPHLARSFQGDQDVEGLIRPRMPVVLVALSIDGTSNNLRNSPESAIEPRHPLRNGHHDPPGTLGRLSSGFEQPVSRVPPRLEANSLGEAHHLRDKHPSTRQQDISQGHQEDGQIRASVEVARGRGEKAESSNDHLSIFHARPPLDDSLEMHDRHVSKRPRLEPVDGPSPDPSASKRGLSEIDRVNAAGAGLSPDYDDVVGQLASAKGAGSVRPLQEHDTDSDDDNFVIPPLVLDTDSEDAMETGDDAREEG